MWVQWCTMLGYFPLWFKFSFGEKLFKTFINHSKQSACWRIGLFPISPTRLLGNALCFGMRMRPVCIEGQFCLCVPPGTNIVAVMIGYVSGMELAIRLQQGIAVTLAIEVGKQHGPWMSHYSVFFVSISFFIVTAATVGYFIFYSARRLNNLRQQNRNQVPLRIWMEGCYFDEV